jgi:peroxiredoxin
LELNIQPSDKSDYRRKNLMSAPQQSLAESKTLKVGDTAPDFTLRDAKGNEVTLSSFRGKKNVVLAFFPYAFSSTCSVQMPSYESQLERFSGFDTQVLGISMDSQNVLSAWADQYGISFPLLSDFYPQGKVVDLYGARHAAGMPERALFAIDKEGTIRWIHVHKPTSESPNNEELFGLLQTLTQ